MGSDNSGSHNKKQQRKEIALAYSMFSQIGINIIVCVAIGLVLGRFLDNLLGTSPWLLIIFLFLGIAAAFKSLIDIAKKL